MSDSMKELLKKVYMLNLAPVSPDMDKFQEILLEELEFKVHEYNSDNEYNGWVVPKSWEAKKAEIKKDGKLVYDGLMHPLGVIKYSQSFSGKVSLEELKKHLFYKNENPDAIVYHCDLFYKVGKKDWGFCMPYNKIKELEEGEYEVKLVTAHAPGKMKVLDYFLPGKSRETIIFNAHNCHAAQANDDIAGVVIGVELMKRLAQLKERKYSYRLIIAPEHLGTVFYLSGLPKEEVENFKYCIFLEMLGNENRIALQESFTGKSEMDRAAHHYLKHSQKEYFSDKFRKIVGNDETVWEAPGYEVPTISLSRFPYDEYHTDGDNEDIISEDMLEDSVKVVMGILNILETNCAVERKFNGLIALSNPKYDLYMRTNDPSISEKIDDSQGKWNYLMDCIPRYFDGKMSILDMAQEHDLPYWEIRAYLEKFREKGLVEFC